MDHSQHYILQSVSASEELVLPPEGVISLVHSVTDDDKRNYGEIDAQTCLAVEEKTNPYKVSELVVPDRLPRGGTPCQSEEMPSFGFHYHLPHCEDLVAKCELPEFALSKLFLWSVSGQFTDAKSKLKCGEDGAKNPIRSHLETYTRDPPWPHLHIHRLRPEVMVKAGFIFTGKEDLVKCQTCFLEVGGWLQRTSLEPLVVHRREQPLCPFVQGLTSAPRVPPPSVPAPMMAIGYYSNLYEQVSADAKGSGRRGLSRYSTRLESFREYDSSLPVSKYALADAGFFLVELPDYTECFACAMVLKDWEEGDEPMKEHKSLAPHCSYVKAVERAEAEMRQASSQPFQGSVGAEITQWGRRQTGLEQQFTGMSVEATPMPNVVLSGRDAHMETYRPPPLAQGNLTATSELPPTPPGAHRRHGADYKKPSQYRHWSGENDPVPPILYPPAGREKRGFTHLPAATSFGAMSHSPSPYGSGLSSTEIESEIKLCRICMDKDIDAIFLPCGHVYCCSQCAKSVKVCPFCRRQVEKISHAYLPF